MLERGANPFVFIVFFLFLHSLLFFIFPFSSSSSLFFLGERQREESGKRDCMEWEGVGSAKGVANSCLHVGSSTRRETTHLN